MDKQSRTFLEFHGRSIFLAAHDGQYWVALKPICQAFGVNYDRQYKNLKDDPFLVQLYAEQHIVAADGKLRKMVCLPERYIYGWVFSIRSESPELLAYKRECYDVLFDYFHGPLTQRIQALRQKTDAELEIDRLTAELLGSEVYQKLQSARRSVKTSSRELARLDHELQHGQLTIWHQGNN